MKNQVFNRHGLAAFTLVEMLVSIVVFSILIILLAQMVNSTSLAISSSGKLLDMDDQARSIFERMAIDFARIPTRNDMDVIFSKEGDPATGTAAGDDKIFFYSVAMGANPYIGSNENNPLTLVGYCIAADAQRTSVNGILSGTYLQDLNRLGRGLSWDLGGITPSTDNVVYLTYSTTGVLNPSGTLDGHWSPISASQSIGAVGVTAFSINSYIPPPGSGGNTPSNTPPSDLDYHVLGDQVIRFEYCFLLNNGTYSNYPAENFTASANGVNYVSNLNNLGFTPVVPPGPNDDAYGNSTTGYKFCTGSRWFDCVAGRAYICTSANSGAAVWTALGTQDIAAIVVAIVLVDRDTRQQVKSVGGWNALPRKFTDPTDANLSAHPPVLMQQTWQAELNALTPSSIGLPSSVLARTQIYQRYFYLHTTTL